MAIANVEIKVTVTHTANLGNFENVKIEVTETKLATENTKEAIREALTDELLTFALTKGKQVKKKRKKFIK